MPIAIPASKNLTLGKGELHFALFAAGTQNPLGERLLGNCPEFTMNREAETIDHFSSMRGRKLLDDQSTLGITTAGTISCDDVDPANLAMHFLGTSGILTVGSATGVVNTFVGVTPGLQYQLGTTASAPSGARKVTAVVVREGATVAVEGVDYDVDLNLARVTPLAGGMFAAGDTMAITFNISSSTRTTIISADELIEGTLRFVSYNPKGIPVDYFFPWVKIQPNGDIPLITEEFMTVPLKITALSKGSLAQLYADGKVV